MLLACVTVASGAAGDAEDAPTTAPAVYDSAYSASEDVRPGLNIAAVLAHQIFAPAHRAPPRSESVGSSPIAPKEFIGKLVSVAASELGGAIAELPPLAIADV